MKCIKNLHMLTLPFDDTFGFFILSTKMTDLTFLANVVYWTDAIILSYAKMLSYAKDLTPDICRKHINNSK